jgi:hypothetical protein
MKNPEMAPEDLGEQIFQQKTPEQQTEKHPKLSPEQIGQLKRNDEEELGRQRDRMDKFFDKDKDRKEESEKFGTGGKKYPQSQSSKIKSGLIRRVFEAVRYGPIKVEPGPDQDMPTDPEAHETIERESMPKPIKKGKDKFEGGLVNIINALTFWKK